MVNNVEDEKRTAALVSLIGGKTYGLLKSLTAPEAPSNFTFKQLTDLLRNHFNPEPLIILRNDSDFIKATSWKKPCRSTPLTCVDWQGIVSLERFCRMPYGTGLFVAWQVSTSRKNFWQRMN